MADLNKVDFEKEVKRVKSVLKTPEGVAALNAVLNLKVEAPAPTDDRPIVAVLVPTFRAPMPEMQNAFAAMRQYTVDQRAAWVIPSPIIATSVVHWSRNELLATLIRSGRPFTHVLFMDDDMGPPPDALVKMLAHGKDIVGALCTVRQDPPKPNMRLINFETGDAGDIWRWQTDALIGDKLPAGHTLAIGTGMMLISRDALEKMASAHLNCDYEREILKMPEEILERVKEARVRRFDDPVHGGNGWWFRFRAGSPERDEYGEDIYFCWQAKRFCNINTYVDTSVQPKHYGPYGYSIPDYLDEREHSIQKHLQAGAYIPPSLLDEEPDSIAVDKRVKKSGISILCPTRGRPENVKRLLESLKATCAAEPEVIFYQDEDDETVLEVGDCRVIRGPRRTLSACWNECAKVATRDILMVGADDIVFKTKGWDTIVEEAFAKSTDKILMAFGDDGAWGDRLATHPIVHRKWFEAIGYITPPHFSADYCDTWIYEIAQAINRKVYLPFVNEHLHPVWNKAEMDATYQDKYQRLEKDEVGEKYKALAPERQADIDKLLAIIGRKLVSVLIPSRGKPEKLREAVNALLAKAANKDGIEILVRVDSDDDLKRYTAMPNVRYMGGERHGYAGLHKYYNELAAHAQGEWLLLWNDDAVMETQDWDVRIAAAPRKMSVLNLKGEVNSFPAIHRHLYQLLGHIAQQSHVDTWMQQVSREAGCEVNVPLRIAHGSREDMGGRYATRDQYFSPAIQEQIAQDIAKVKEAMSA